MTTNLVPGRPLSCQALELLEALFMHLLTLLISLVVILD
jgi:hypothetical protein